MSETEVVCLPNLRAAVALLRIPPTGLLSVAVTPSSAALALLLRGSMTSKEGETPGERGSESYRQSRVENQRRTELRAPRRLQQEPGSADLAPGAGQSSAGVCKLRRRHYPAKTLALG